MAPPGRAGLAGRPCCGSRAAGPAPTGRGRRLLLWGGWLVVTGLVFSFAQGIIHPYYTVALAPAIGALVGIGAVTPWRHRAAGRRASCSPPPWLPPRCGPTCCLTGPRSGTRGCAVAVLVGGLLAAVAVPASSRLRRAGSRRRRPRAPSGRRWRARPPTPSTPWPRPTPGPSRGGAHRRRGGRLGGPAAGSGGGGCPRVRVRAVGRRRVSRRPFGAGGRPGAPAGRAAVAGTGGFPAGGPAPAARRGGGPDASRRGPGGARPVRAASSTPARRARPAVVAAQSRRQPLQVGGRHRGLQQRGRLPAGDRGPGDGRSAASTAPTRRRPCRSSRRDVAARQDPLLHRRGRRFGAGGGAGRGTSSAITSWVEQHFRAATIDGVTVYDLTA